MISLLALAIAAQEVPPVATPGEVLRCAEDASVKSALCRATVAQGEGRHADSARFFEEAALLAADAGEQARANAAAGAMWLAAGDPTRALGPIDAALASQTLDAMQRGFTLIDRATALYGLSRADEALVALDDAATLVDQDPYLWFLGGRIALDLERFDDAELRVGNGLLLAPDSPELLHLAGLVAIAKGEPDSAKDYWRKAVLAAPGHPAARAAGQGLQLLVGDEAE
ncbi:tetratricopeptide repeat protein [Sphingomicrobium sediminis]|uniref:Tetratricopeptide repeat protein n=1 Tax=Sphingomicrobium sediminis TaxID=2950949 RepID=A0A9X2J556_9SPHN|nr:hypothetical protein [Sphingomicrobium sediminis]MCM8557907.1 hypothetical protein [Sphingomicrobium sediminis]